MAGQRQLDHFNSLSVCAMGSIFLVWPPANRERTKPGPNLSVRGIAQRESGVQDEWDQTIRQKFRFAF